MSKSTLPPRHGGYRPTKNINGASWVSSNGTKGSSKVPRPPKGEGGGSSTQERKSA